MMNKVIEKDAIYFDIIVGLLNPPFEYDSLIKIMFMAFIMKNCEPKIDKNVISLDLISKFIKNLRTEFFINYKDFENIFRIIKILENSNFIVLEGNKVIQKSEKFDYNVQSVLFKHKAIQNTVNEIKKMSDKAFIEEVVRYV